MNSYYYGGGGMFFMWLLGYVYMSLCLYKMAQQNKIANAWLAWIPIVNVFIFLQVAGRPLWWFILLLIPLVNIVIGVIIWMDAAKKMGKPSWVGILVIVPLVNIFVPGYVAFAPAVSTTPSPAAK